MLWKLKRKSLAALSKFLRWCSDCINEYLWRDVEIVWNKAAEQSFAPDASPDTVASVCEHGHITACPHGCR